jgi:diguanylate cyclase (GGDEF)-like protein
VDPVPAHPTDPAGATLRLDTALALLRQAGRGEPAGVHGSATYLQALIDQLVDLSSRDALTGLANRRNFELSLAREVDRVARSGESALLLMVDIDHFKRVNDTHGHAAGDRVIQAVGQALTDSVRPMDLVARIGGEEYAVLLPNCPPAFGPQVAARVRQRVARSSVALNGGTPLAVTVSVGGAFAPQWVRSTPGIWLQRADLQLYRAKAEGRDRVCLEHSAAPAVSAQEREMLLGAPKPAKAGRSARGSGKVAKPQAPEGAPSIQESE